MFKAKYYTENLLAKSDYAAKGGSYLVAREDPVNWSPGPPGTCLETYSDCNWGSFSEEDIFQDYNYGLITGPLFNGVVIPRFPIKLVQVTDGLSKTMLVGEKFLSPDLYKSKTAAAVHDNNSAYDGYSSDAVRWTHHGEDALPLRDTNRLKVSAGTEIDRKFGGSRFGSAHPNSFNTANWDGSVHAISYDIDPVVWRYLGVRDDVQITSP